MGFNKYFNKIFLLKKTMRAMDTLSCVPVKLVDTVSENSTQIKFLAKQNLKFRYLHIITSLTACLQLLQIISFRCSDNLSKIDHILTWLTLVVTLAPSMHTYFNRNNGKILEFCFNNLVTVL